MKMKIAALLLSVSLSVACWAGPGASVADAVGFDSSTSVTLVEGTDRSGGSPGLGNGVYHLGFKLPYGKSCTVRVSGSKELKELDVRSHDPSVVDPESLWFGVSGNTATWDTGDWTWIKDADGNSPASCKFWVYLEGPKGATYTVTRTEGESAAPERVSETGASNNPAKIEPTDDLRTKTCTFVDGAYYITFPISKGTSYKFGSVGAKSTSKLTFAFFPASQVAETTLDDWSKGDDIGVLVTARENGTCTLCVTGSSATFKLQYQKITGRTPEDHKPTVLETPTADAPTSVVCTPGHRSTPGSVWKDDVIDEQLFKVVLQAGQPYKFWTAGADKDIVLEVYNAAGTCLARNRRGFSDGFDCLSGFMASTAGTYYVGVCQDLADASVTPTCGAITLHAAVVETDGAKTDKWDPNDDVLATVEEDLMPGLGTKGDDPVAKGSLHGPHWLGLTDWVDVYRFEVRKGVTYAFKATLADTAYTYCPTRWKLGGTVVSNGKVQMTVEDLVTGGAFTPQQDGVCSLEVRVTDGQGIDYPYNLHALAYDPNGGALGRLRVAIGGVTAKDGAYWTLKSDGKSATKHVSGESVLVPADTPVTVVFSSVTGWNNPENGVYTVAAGETLDAPVAKYTDAKDAKPIADDGREVGKTVKGDGARNGEKVTELKLESGAKAQSFSRSLWKEDPADWFKLTANVNTRYSLRFADPTVTGDAVIRLFDSDGTMLLSEGVAIDYLYLGAKKGTLYACVTHLTADARDSQYELVCSAVQVGEISFSKTRYAVKDGAASVTIPVTRSDGKAGSVRVRYATRANTARPGTNYVNQTGVLEWKDGKTDKKNIVIKLIPQLVASWAEDVDFSVVLTTLEPESADEYVPRIGNFETVVTISPSAKKTSGSVRFCGWGDGNAAFANAKKPAVDVTAGERLTLWLVREGGSDGDLAVKVTPTKGTASADVDYVSEAQTLVWADGETAPKPFVLRTIRASEDYAAAKTMTVKVAADGTYAESSKEAKGWLAKSGTSVSVSIGAGCATGALADYTSTLKKADGLAVKESKSNTWYFDEAGTLRSVVPAAGGKAELTLTLTGPGRLSFTPDFLRDADDRSTLTCQVGKRTVTLANGEENVLYVDKGSTTVKFTLARDKKSTDETLVTFADCGDGQPFSWKKLPTPELVSPLEKEVALSVSHYNEDSKMDEEWIPFSWTAPDDPDVLYVFKLASSAKNLKNDKLLDRQIVAKGCAEVSFGCPQCGQSGLMEPGETYYWRVDTTFADPACTVTNVSTAAWTIRPDYAGTTPRPVIEAGVDADGCEIAPQAEIAFDLRAACTVKLVQGVASDIRVGLCDDVAVSAGSTFSFELVDKKKYPLPKGLTLKNGVISGVPNTVATNTTLVKVAVKEPGDKKAKDKGTLALVFKVEPLRLAAGTFNGLLETEDPRIAEMNGQMAMALGSLSVTVNEKNGMSAKVKLDGKTFTFKGDGYGKIIPALANGQPGVTVTLTNQTKLTIKGEKQAKKYPSVLTLTACRGSVDDAEALDTPMLAEASIVHLSEDGKSVIQDVVWSGRAVRDNAKVDSALAALEHFVGYYTVALPPVESRAGLLGCGYVTIEVKSSGKVTVGGMLADGSTEVSGSALGVVREGADGRLEMQVPLCIGSSGKAFGGWLTVKLGPDGVPFVKSKGERLVWINTSKSSTYEGDRGFFLHLEPTGGYFNTLYNLQTYYLEERFKVRGLQLEEVPSEFFGGKTPTVYPGLLDEYLTVAGNSITMAKNDANLKFEFKRATGVFKGSFDVKVRSGTKDVKLSSTAYSHAGVMLMTRDAEAEVLPEDAAVMAGYYLLKNIKLGSRNWTATLPFLIVPEAVEYNWFEE